MIKLNDTSIAIGEIKQLLATFNLPNCDVGEYSEIAKNRFYINNNKLIHNGDTISYVFNKKYLNITTTLPIWNNTYDVETHRYLGRYLRFIRDYKKVDLLSMYNFFDKQYLDYTFYIDYSLEDSSKGTIPFKNDSDEYHAYSIPFDLLDRYTLYTSSPIVLEMCISMNDLSENENIINIRKNTYKKVYTSSKPKLIEFYSNLSTSLKNIIYANKDKFSLVIKVPENFSGQLVILNGNFTKQIKTFSNLSQSFKLIDEKGGEETSYLKGVREIKNQLMSSYNNNNYLLSDRLIEYLSDMAISPLSEDYNISKLQKLLVTNNLLTLKGNYGIRSGQEEDIINNIIGTYLQDKYDTLGYCDKDVENVLIRYGGLV